MGSNNFNLKNTYSPGQIVKELDRYIRMKTNKSIINDIVPKNILMIGPTGVGKTEIARRISLLYNAPFIKVEATRFTEIGYVGKDVESIIKDLVDISIKNERKKKREEVLKTAKN